MDIRPEISLYSKKKSKRSRTLTSAFLYASVLILIASVASISYRPPVNSSTAGALGSLQSTTEATKPSVDQLAVANLAAGAAEVAGLSIASEVSSMSITLNANNELALQDEAVISKPQIFEPTASSALSTYKSVVGDTAPSVASRFGISAQTLRWANNLTGDAIVPNTDVVVPSIDGVVYTTKDGDTVDAIADKYKSDTMRIISKNNLEISGVVAGQKILLPGGTLPENERPGYVAPRAVVSSGNSYIGSSNYSVQAGNRYSYGYCTWYVYNKRSEIGRPIGSLWGNASSWAYAASAAGYVVNRTPEVGAVMQNGGGLGHVAFVERVNPDGSFEVSEMNYRGWNVVSWRSISAGAAANYNFIHGN